MTVRMESNPSDSGSFTIKSIAMVWNGSAPVVGVMGDKVAFCGCVFTLFCWHCAQPLTYSCLSLMFHALLLSSNQSEDECASIYV